MPLNLSPDQAVGARAHALDAALQFYGGSGDPSLIVQAATTFHAFLTDQPSKDAPAEQTEFL